MSNPPWMNRPADDGETGDDADRPERGGADPSEPTGPRPGSAPQDPMRDISALFGPLAGGGAGGGGARFGGGGGGGGGGGR